MTAFIFRLTLRQLVGRKSTLLLVGLGLIPLLVAVVFRLSEPDIDPDRWAARVLYVGLIVTAILPLTVLLLGTSVLGDELEDGTAVYLLTKPMPRWQILLPKLMAAWVVSSLLVLASAIPSGAIALQGQGDSSLVLGFSVAILAGAFAYTAAFVLLSIVTTRALIAGLVYVFLWEGAITGIFEGTRFLSIRHYTIGFADWIAGAPTQILDAYVGGLTAAFLLAVVSVAGVIFANRRLEQAEVRESS